MKVNNYINLSNINYFTSPYVDGASNVARGFSSNHTHPLTLSNRVLHVVAGITLLIPVINTVFYAALKFFATTRVPSPIPTTSAPDSRALIPPPSHSKIKMNSPATSSPKPTSSKKPIKIKSTPPPAPAFHGAGILPYRIVHGELELLIGKEAHGIHKNTWSDFGGQPNTGETPRQTAARECAEETGNLLGKRSTLEKSLKKSHCIGVRYAMFLLEADDPKITPKRFSHAHHDGEKSKIAWVKANDLFRAAAGNGMIAIDGSLEKLRPPFIGTLKFRGTATSPSAHSVFARIQAEHPLRHSA